MKDLIKKILREGMQISDDAPDWVKEFHTLPREGRIEIIKKNKRQIEKLLPRIVEFFESILLQFFFHHKTRSVGTLKKEIISDLKSFFNLDYDYYGMPLDLEFFKATWERF